VKIDVDDDTNPFVELDGLDDEHNRMNKLLIDDDNLKIAIKR
jgi:hypothetical protein